jgi:ATP-dependent Clp protease ATP-binding subunit ClpA
VVPWLAQQGYEPEYGARPLRRLLRRRIENPLATELLEERFLGASAVQVSLLEAAGELRFTPINIAV